MAKRLTTCAALMLLLSLPAHAAMYKWVDKDGSVVYSEVPPPDAGDVKTIAPPPPPPDAPAPVAAEPEADPDQKADPKSKNAETPEAVAARRKNCEAARGNLEIYRTARSIFTPEQERVVLDDATRAARIKETEKQIADNCK